MLRVLGRQTSGNVQKVLFLLEEIGLPYKREDYGRQFNNTNTDAYRALNPNMKVPTLVDGDVSTWEPHGLECTVCIDVATEARQMFTSGASVRDIRAAIEKKWAGFNGGHTPTPAPPSKSE